MDRVRKRVKLKARTRYSTLFLLLMIVVNPFWGITQPRPVKAPEFPTGLTWLNCQEPLSLEKIKGYVVLLYFWTYSGVSCQHILPDVEYLQEKYRDQPFLVIGVHSGRFPNEHEPANVRAALMRYGISQPTVVDETLSFRKKYGLKMWPTFILLDGENNGVLILSGEKRRHVLDQVIQDTLKQGKKNKTLLPKKWTYQELPEPSTVLYFPTKLAFDANENVLYIADSGHHQIVAAKLTTPLSAEVMQRLGSGKKGCKDGIYSVATFANPQGLAFHENTLYVADTDNHAIRAVQLKEKKITTLCGNGQYGAFGLPNSPTDLVFKDNTLFITMAGNHQLWQLDVLKKKMTLWVGNGYPDKIDGSAMGSSLAQPSCITMDEKGEEFFFVDSESSALRSFSTTNKQVKTLICAGLFKYGFMDGKFATAALQNPQSIQYDAGKILLADTFNHALRLADLKREEIITLISRQNNNPDSPLLWEPSGVLMVSPYIYIADTNNHLIRVYHITTKQLENLKLVN